MRSIQTSNHVTLRGDIEVASVLQRPTTFRRSVRPSPPRESTSGLSTRAVGGWRYQSSISNHINQSCSAAQAAAACHVLVKGLHSYDTPSAFGWERRGIDAVELGARQVARASADAVSGFNGAPTAVTVAAEGGKETLQREERRMESIEGWLENRIFNCRFLTLMAVIGSLVGSTLCFIKGSIFVAESAKVFVINCLRGMNSGRVIMLLVEALDVYLIGTVMLIFGMGLYELFIDSLQLPKGASANLRSRTSSLFGLFPLRARPKWLEISSLDEMKSKLGHVIVMILLVGMFEKSKKVHITTASDLFLFSASVALAATCLYLLSKLHGHGEAEGEHHH